MDVLDQVRRVLDEMVRPQLAAHNGDVAVLDFSDGVLRIRLTGQCSGCPSASITTENLIAAEVRARVPEVRDVVLVNGVSDSLLAQARALLAERRA